MSRHSQKGSALLIVLGFLSFMVVSAVAFAVWMRNERLPSSALRRAVANRYLVKAALAQAMSRVDDAIRSHVFPGAWNTNLQNTVYRDCNGWAYDWWESRVFMPPNSEGMVDYNDNSVSPDKDRFLRYAPVTKTVSVLNLEALGYLPPALINDVRLLARSSWAAQWDYFNFDAGRYAFCAVNVSDMFDVNKLAADTPRTSAAAVRAPSSGEKPPPSRFSLAYLFRNNDEGFAGPDGRMKDFDDCVHVNRPDWGQAPFVSMLDYNLALGYKDGTFRSPFYDYVSGDIQGKFFYGGGRDTPLAKRAERQQFVTASWFPPSNLAIAKSDGTSNKPLDLTLHQPFLPGTMKLGNNNNMEYTQTAENRVFWETMLNNSRTFCEMDQLTLFDYLDEDDVPLSLAMPCAERVPMITALAPVGNVQVEFVPPAAEPSETVNEGTTVRKKYYDTKMKITLGGMGMSATLLFPFKGGKQPVQCTAQAFARLVFIGEAAGGDGAAGAVTLRNSGFARNFRPLNDSEWTAGVDQEKQFKLEEGAMSGILSHTPADNCLLVTMPGQYTSWTPPANIRNEQDCWTDLQLQLTSDPQLERTIIRKIEIYKVTPATAEEPERETLTETRYQIVLRPFDANGNVIAVPDGELELAAFDAECAKYAIRPYLVTWVRVVQNGKTVDMVPATYEDDKAFNGVDNTSLMHMPINNPLGNTSIQGESQNPQLQRALPIMRFPGTLSFTYTDAKGGTYNQQNVWKVKSCYAVDPRFNWAPEDWWFDTADASPTGQKWYEAVFNDNGILDKLVGYEFGSDYQRADRANDPFLFVSNLGYLQSVGELAFLPRLSDMDETGAEPNCVLGDKKNTGSHDGSLYDGNPREMQTSAPDQTVLETMPCALAAWKSYQSYRTNPKIEHAFELGANLYRRGLVNGTQDFYVNPYTQSQEVMLAALANTPLNYWVAGTNYTAQGKAQFSNFNSFKNSMFSDSGNSRITGRDLNKIATFLRRRFEDLASMLDVNSLTDPIDLYAYQRVWEDMFDALDWSGALENSTIEHVYDRLEDYYDGGSDENNSNNYRKMYTRGSVNSYSDLHRFALGGPKQVVSTTIRLNKDRAVHKEDFRLSADPLRGQYAQDKSDTSCWEELCDVDRKFLHSYWRDCFANRQQLFLIFVRAESTALGGAGEGTPAQQGGRAVALVWRDPNPPSGGNVDEKEGIVNNSIQSGKYDLYSDRHPHKMRILFYRQLD